MPLWRGLARSRDCLSTEALVPLTLSPRPGREPKGLRRWRQRLASGYPLGLFTLLLGS
jgi:hypothetical protein